MLPVHRFKCSTMHLLCITLFATMCPTNSALKFNSNSDSSLEGFLQDLSVEVNWESSVMPYNLQSIEESLVEMVKEGKVTPELLPFVKQIYSLTDDMKKQIKDQQRISQSILDGSWNDFVSCSVNYKNVSTDNLTTLSAKHLTCRQNQSDSWVVQQEGIEKLKILVATTDMFYQQHVTYEANHIRSCLNDPLQNATSTLPKMQYWANVFKELSAQWNVTYLNWQAAKRDSDAQKEIVDSNTTSYLTLRTQCDSIQDELENTGCNMIKNDNCDNYCSCWDNNKSKWLETNTSQTAAADGRKEEWRTILRIECLLDAFVSEIVNGTDLAVEVQKCMNKDYYAPDFDYHTLLTLNYFPSPSNPMPAYIYCNATTGGVIPQSQKWLDQYYPSLPKGTTYKECSAQCCTFTANPRFHNRTLFQAGSHVKLFQWSWDDVALECETFLGPKGFEAVHVSSPTEHAMGSSWTNRLQPVSYNLTSSLGSTAKFARMVQRCAKVGVDVIAEIIPNHMAPLRNGLQAVGVAGSVYGPGRSYPIYGPEHFHHSANDLNANDALTSCADSSNCWNGDLSSQPDLDTSKAYVQQTIRNLINSLISMGVAGIYVRNAQQISPTDLSQIASSTSQGLPWLSLDVMAATGDAVQPSLYTSLGAVSEYKYAKTISTNFKADGKLKNFADFGSAWGMGDPKQSFVYLDHELLQRDSSSGTLSSSDGKLYYAAHIFMLAHPYGYPQIMSSFAFNSSSQGAPSNPVHDPSNSSLNCGQGDWICEHRQPEIANMVGWRRAAGSSQTIDKFTTTSEGNQMAFCRGQAACVAINIGSSPWSFDFETNIPAGIYYDVIRNGDYTAGSRITVNDAGIASITVPSMSGVAFHINAKP